MGHICAPLGLLEPLGYWIPIGLAWRRGGEHIEERCPDLFSRKDKLPGCGVVSQQPAPQPPAPLRSASAAGGHLPEATPFVGVAASGDETRRGCKSPGGTPLRDLRPLCPPPRFLQLGQGCQACSMALSPLVFPVSLLVLSQGLVPKTHLASQPSCLSTVYILPSISREPSL